MNAPFNREHITQHWQPLDWEEPLQPSSRQWQRFETYFRHYGLDFPDQQPLTHYFGYFTVNGEHLALHHWRPSSPRGTILVCHGYFDHVGLYRHIIGHLLGLGYAVLAYDLPGHGLSGGHQASIDDFEHYQDVLTHCLELAQAHCSGPWMALGQSTGGAILMDYLLNNPGHPFTRVFLLAPLVRPYKWSTGRLLHSLISPFAKGLKRVFTINSNDPDFLDFLENNDPLQARYISANWVSALKRWIPYFEALPKTDFSPVIIQGDRDETVDWRHNLAVIRGKFARPEIFVLPGARHQLANEGVPYRSKIFAILDRYLRQSAP